MDAVSKKVGGFVRHIEAGAWCDSRRSLMNAYAFGVLDREGRALPAASRAPRGLPAVPALRPGGAGPRGDRPADLASNRPYRRRRGHSRRAVGAVARAPRRRRPSGQSGRCQGRCGARRLRRCGGGRGSSAVTATGGGVAVKAAAIVAAAIATAGGAAAIGLVELPARADGNPPAQTQAAIVKEPAPPAGAKSISLAGGPHARAVVTKKPTTTKPTRNRAGRRKRPLTRAVHETTPSRTVIEPTARREVHAAAGAASAPSGPRRAAARPSGSEFDPEG